MSLGAARTMFFNFRSGPAVVLTSAVIAVTAPNPAMQSGTTLVLSDAAQIRIVADDPILPSAQINLGTGYIAVTAPNPDVTYSAFDVGPATIGISNIDPTIRVASDTWANSYTYRRTLVVPSAIITGGSNLPNFPLLLRETRQSFRSVANGGKIQSGDGYDIRFETPSALKSGHEREVWSASTGEMRAWVNIPSISASADTRHHLYYGNAAVADDENDPASLWSGYALVSSCLDGSDRTGQGRDLDAAGVTAGELFGPCGSFSGASVLKLPDASFLSGATALTVQFYAQPDASMVGSNHGFLTVNTPSGSDNAAALVIQYLASTSVGANVIHVRAKTASGYAQAFSVPNTHSSLPQLVHVVLADGSVPKIYINGSDVTSTTSTLIQNGGLVLGSGGLFVGAGARDTTVGGYVGLLDELRIYPAARTAGWIAAEAQSYLSPSSFYGLGGEDLSTDTNLSVVAVPLVVTATVGAAKDIDAAAAGYEPEGGAKTITGTPTIGSGTVSIVSNKLRATASLLPTIVSFTLRDSSSKQSSSTVTMRAGAPIVTLPPAYDWSLKYPAAETLKASTIRPWKIGTALPSVYNIGDTLLAYGDASTRTKDAFWPSGAKLKGSMILVGETMEPTGRLYSNGSTAAHPYVGINNLFNIAVDKNARHHDSWVPEPGQPAVTYPVVMFCNIRINFATNNCNFGDCFRVGYGTKSFTPPSGASSDITVQNDNTTHASRGPKVVVMFNKIDVQQGPHYGEDQFSDVNATKKTGSNIFHSDFFQSQLGVLFWSAADSHFHALGGQGFFCSEEAELLGFPRHARQHYINCSWEHGQTDWNPYTPSQFAFATGSGLSRNPKFVMNNEEGTFHPGTAYETSPATPANPATGQPYIPPGWPRGAWFAAIFEGQCYIKGRFTDATNINKYITRTDGVANPPRDANGNWQWLPNPSTSDNDYPPWAGNLRYIPPTGTLPVTCPIDHAGDHLRVNSVDALLGILQPSKAITRRSGLPWTSGAALNETPSKVAAFEAYRGSKIDVTVTYSGGPFWGKEGPLATADLQWAKMLTSTKEQPGGVIAQFMDMGIAVVHCLAMLVKQEDGDFKSIAAGTRDSQHATIAGRLASWLNTKPSDYPILYLCFGQEVSGTGYPWAFTSYSNGSTDADYVAANRRIIAIYKAALGSRIKVCYNTVKRSGDLTNRYPGDDVIDVITSDPYDNGYDASYFTTSKAAGFATWLAGVYSGPAKGYTALSGLVQFAIAHGKTWGMQEWNASRKRNLLDPSDALYIDPAVRNPNNKWYMEGMNDFIRANASTLEFEAVFNQIEDDHQIFPETVNLPQPSRAYAGLWREPPLAKPGGDNPWP